MRSLRPFAALFPLVLLLSACTLSEVRPTATVAMPPTPVILPTPTLTTIDCPGYGKQSRLHSAPPPAAATATTMMLTQELDAAERTWRAAGITHYRISVKIDGYATPQPPYVVEVQDGVTLTGMQRFTVSGLFATIRQALADPCQTVST